jgi:putative transport protein
MTVSESGMSSLIYGAIILLTLVIITALVSFWIFRLPFDTAIGVIAGATGNPAIIAFASRTAPTDRPDVGYAMIFPSMTIFKILLVQIASVFLR